jgi:DNA-binding MurR/RpiR family transcriptional regulator
MLSRQGSTKVVNDFDDIQERLTRLHPTLPPKLRHAAKFLLENPGEIATQSMRTIAANSGVALPNFARLAKAIGFDKYNELRDVYRKRVQAGAIGGYPERANRLQSSGKVSGDNAVWASFREAALKSIENVYARIDAHAIASVAEKLLKRDTIFVVGMQSSYPFADYLSYVGGMVASKIRLLGRRSGIIADDLIDISTRDALVCLAIQPCARATVQVAELAYGRGVYVVGITDSPASPLAAYSSEVLVTSCNSPLFFDSYVGSTAIIELLIGFMTLRSGPDVIGRIAQIEADRRRLGEYWSADRNAVST